MKTKCLENVLKQNFQFLENVEHIFRNVFKSSKYRYIFKK